MSKSPHRNRNIATLAVIGKAMAGFYGFRYVVSGPGRDFGNVPNIASMVCRARTAAPLIHNGRKPRP